MIYLKRFSNKRVRIIVYLIGSVILSFGLCLNMKANFGVSSVISVVYVLTVVFSVPIGIITFIYYCFFVWLQKLLLGEEFERIQYMQIIASFLTSAFLQLFDVLITGPKSVYLRVFFIVAGVFCTGLGSSFMVGMRLVPNPADGLADTIGYKIKKGLGTGKNILDAASIITAFILGMLFKKPFLGIGIGTVCAVIFTGRVMALVQPLTDYILKKATKFEPTSCNGEDTPYSL